MLFPADIPKLWVVFSTQLQANTSLADFSVEAQFLKNFLVPLVVLDFVWVLPAVRWQTWRWKFCTVTSFILCSALPLANTWLEGSR